MPAPDITVTSDIWALPDLTTNERVVLAAYRQAMAAGCGFNMRQLSEHTQICYRTVRESLRVLRACRYIVPDGATKVANSATLVENGATRKEERERERGPSSPLPSHTHPSPLYPPKEKEREEILPQVKPAGTRLRTEHDDWFDKVAAICKLDPKLKNVPARISKLIRELQEAGYTMHNLNQFAWWWDNVDFRGIKAQPPTIQQVIDHIKTAVDYKPRARAPARDSWQADYTPEELSGAAK